MDTVISLPYGHERPLPPGHTDEVRAPENLVERFLAEFSDPGDHVLDPFTGYGTTLVVAGRLGREPRGVEYDPDRVDHARDRLADAGGDPDRVRQGDARELDADDLPPIDLCFTSPPLTYRTADTDPFRNYDGESTYEDYLDDVETVFRSVESALRPGGRAVVDVVNLKGGDEAVTPLAFEVTDRVDDVLRFDGEVVVAWEREGEDPEDGRLGYGYDHSYCLLFTKASTR